MEETKKNSRWNAKKTRTLTGMAMLTAIVVALELFAGFSGIKFGPVNITLALAPIIVGAALYGWKAGAWLGFVFSVVVCFEPDTASFMKVSAPATIVTVIVKGTVAGLVGGLVYMALEKKNKYAAVLVSGVVMPLVNTGLFLVGCMLFFLDTVKAGGEGLGYSNVFAYMIFGLTGLNFLVELGINFVLSSAISMIIKTVRKQNAKS